MKHALHFATKPNSKDIKKSYDLHPTPPPNEKFLDLPLVLRFSPLLKNQHFQIPILPGIRYCSGRTTL